MKRRFHLLAAAVVTATLTAPVAVFGQETKTHDHSAHQAAPANTIDDLLKKMNASQGDAKTAAMAELLEALVADRHSCETMMAKKMGGSTPDTHKGESK